MIVVDANDLRGRAREASGPGWSIIRMLMKSNNTGFPMNETIVQAGASLTLEYKNHCEGCVIAFQARDA